MNNKNNTLPWIIIGVLGMAGGLVFGRIREKHVEKQLREEEAFHQQLVDYGSNLAAAVDQYKTEVDQISQETDAFLKLLEEIDDLEEEEL